MPPSDASAPGSTGKQSPVAELRIERDARHAGLNPAVHILRVHGQHAVHLGKIEANAAIHRLDMTLERCSRSERDQRGPGLSA